MAFCNKVFFDDREVRAVWDEAGAKWWFSVLDIVGVINAQDDYAKNRNYWKYLKTKLRKNGSELVSTTNQLKLLASDGKRYFTDVLDNACVIALAKSFPNNKVSTIHIIMNRKTDCKLQKESPVQTFFRNFGVE